MTENVFIKLVKSYSEKGLSELNFLPDNIQEKIKEAFDSYGISDENMIRNYFESHNELIRFEIPQYSINTDFSKLYVTN